MPSFWSHLNPFNKQNNQDSLRLKGSSHPSNRKYGHNRQYHVQFFLVGATGAGKTATIQHLFGHNNDLSAIGLKTSNKSSETRETVEYLLNFKQKKGARSSNHFVENVTLGIVDTPGLDDTDGIEQDARNIASIAEFVKSREVIYPDPPNLIFFILKADGTRDFGPESVLARCIRLYLGPTMNLTKDGSNVVIVLTHALNICLNSKAWAKEAMERMRDVQNFVESRTGWKIPVVLLENKLNPMPDNMKKTGDWTRFPDKVTCQPKNLFDSIAEILDSNDDALGKSVLDTFFSRTSKDSQVDIIKGPLLQATRVHQKVPLTELEGQFLQLMNQSRQPPQCEVKNHDPGDGAVAQFDKAEEAVEDDTIDNGQDVESYSRSGSSASDVEYSHGSLLGRAYNLGGDGEILDCQVFQPSFVEENTARKSCAKTVETTLDKCNKNGIFINGKAAGRRQDSLTGGGKADVGGGRKTTDYKVEGSKVVKVLSTKVSFKQNFYSAYTAESSLGDGFRSDLEKIPSKYSDSKKKHFVKFFKKHGQGFIKVGYYGIEARFILAGNGEERDSDAKGSLEASMFSLSLGGSGDGGGSKLIKDRSFKVTFHGGDSAYHREDQLEEWKKTAECCPEELILDVSTDIVLYHDYVAGLKWLDNYTKKAEALELAFADLYSPTRTEVVESEDRRNESIVNRWLPWKS